MNKAHPGTSLPALQNRTRLFKCVFSFLLCLMLGFITASAQQSQIVRIAEITIDFAYLQEYKAILKEEAAASVNLEPGVIAIFPMFQKDDPLQVRILEIYASKAAYEYHLTTPHFQKYKSTTLKMVKHLKLVEMNALDAETMPLVFGKLKSRD